MKGKLVLLVVYGMGDAEPGSIAQANVGMLLKAISCASALLKMCASKAVTLAPSTDTRILVKNRPL